MNLIGEISVETAKYNATITAINDRSMIHLNQIQPTLDAGGLKSGENYSQKDFEDILGRGFSRLYVMPLTKSLLMPMRPL